MKLVFMMMCLVLAQHPNQNFLDKFSGEWSADGKAFGMPAKVSMKWEPALEGKFMKLSYDMEMKTKEGATQVFHGVAFYKPLEDGTFKATWVDSSGDMHPIVATVERQTLTSVWGTPETKLGRTRYTLLDENRVEIVDEINRKGEWKEFNRNTVVRR